MSTETRILELLGHWESLHERGKDLTPEELCVDCPELLTEVKRRLEDLPAPDRENGPALARGDEPSDSDLSQKTGTADGHKTAAPVDSEPGHAADPPQVSGYDILEELGRGGIGHVFKARQRHLDRLVALKIIRPDRLTNPDSVRRFQREARATARLAHPNIVTLFDAGQDGATHYLVGESGRLHRSTTILRSV